MNEPLERTLERIPANEIQETIQGFAQQGWTVSKRVNHSDGSVTITFRKGSQQGR